MDQQPHVFDICILCALYEEASAVFDEFSTRCATSFRSGWSLRDRYEYRWTTLTNHQGEHLTVMVSWLPRPGPVDTARELKGLVQEFCPRFVAMTGICAGFQEHVRLGDLVVASTAYHYEEGKIVSGPDGQPIQHIAPRMESPTDLVLQWAQGFRGWQSPVAELKCQLLADAEPPMCHIAAMASGMAVRADEPFARLREKQHRETLALDMEAASFYQTLRAFPTIHALVVKGVCDYATMQKNDRYHDYAARASALYILTFLQTIVSEQIMPRRSLPLLPERVQVDMSEAPHVEHFSGRRDDVATLTRWIVDDQCRVISILGVGGIGKSSLAAKVADQVVPAFHAVFWYSLLNAPPLERFLHDCLHFLMREQPAELPSEVDEQVRLLFTQLAHRRCLLVLDNAEALLQSGERTTEYKDGYEEYGVLLRRFGESRHQSCLVVTSREQVKALAWLEGEGTSVRSYPVKALTADDARIILARKGVSGEEASWKRVVDHTTGNPLILMILASTIRENYGGHLARYLDDLGDLSLREHPDLRVLLDRQFDRFMPLEQEVMYWLALKRVALSLHDIREARLQPVSKGQVLAALEALRRHCWIEQSHIGFFTLQPALMDAVVDRFTEGVVQEILSERTDLLASHLLMEAQASSFVRASQCHLVLKVIVHEFSSHLMTSVLEKKLRQRLAALRHLPEPPDTYEAGNILNLLVQMGADLRGTDCSRLVVRQAYLQEVELPDVNFAFATLATSVFPDTFGGILSVAWSAQGERLAAGTATGEVRVWDALSGRPLQTLQGHTDWVWSVVFSPDGQTLASGSGDQTIRLWKVRSGQCLAVLSDHTESVWSVAFSPDGDQLASGSGDQTVRLWDVRSRQCVRVLQGHTDTVRSVAFHPDGNVLASGSSDRAVRLWEVSSGQRLSVLPGHSSSVRSVAFHPDGTLVASGSSDQTVRLWDMGSSQCVTILRGHSSALRSVVFSPDGSLLASGSFDRTVRLWEVRSGHCTSILSGHRNAIWSVAFGPDGQTIVSGSDDQTVRLWEVSSSQCLRTLRGSRHGVWSVAFSPDGETLASGGSDGVVRLWEVKRGQCIGALRGHTEGVWSVAFSPDGRKDACQWQWGSHGLSLECEERSVPAYPLRTHRTALLSGLQPRWKVAGQRRGRSNDPCVGCEQRAVSSHATRSHRHHPLARVSS